MKKSLRSSKNEGQRRKTDVSKASGASDDENEALDTTREKITAKKSVKQSPKSKISELQAASVEEFKSETRLAVEAEFNKQLLNRFAVEKCTINNNVENGTQGDSDDDIQIVSSSETTPKLKRSIKKQPYSCSPSKSQAAAVSPVISNSKYSKFDIGSRSSSNSGSIIISPSPRKVSKIASTTSPSKTAAASPPKSSSGPTTASPPKTATSKLGSKSPSASKSAVASSSEINGLLSNEISLLSFLSDKDYPEQNENDVHYKPTDMIDLESVAGKSAVVQFLREGKLSSVSEFRRFVDILRLLQPIAVETQTPFAIVVDFAKKLRFISKIRAACFERRFSILENMPEQGSSELKD